MKSCIAFVCCVLCVASSAWGQTIDTNDVALTSNAQFTWSTNQAAALKSCYRQATNDLQSAYAAALSRWQTLTNINPRHAQAEPQPTAPTLPTLAQWVVLSLRPVAAQWLDTVDAARVNALAVACPVELVRRAWISATLAQQTNWVNAWNTNAYSP